MASARLKKKTPEAPPPSQRERALEAIGRMHSFDSFWLEKLNEALVDSSSSSDGSLSIEELTDASRLHTMAERVNELRKKFPKPWVTT